jgi:hypothetical protein
VRDASHPPVTDPGVVRGLQLAQARVAEARARRTWGRQLRCAEAALRRAVAALDEHPAAQSDVARAREQLELATPPPPGDRWALARELLSLFASGWQSHRVAHALVESNICRGPQSPSARRRCCDWIRQERRRFRRSAGTGSRE